jgi:hypothetical protein
LPEHAGGFILKVVKNVRYEYNILYELSFLHPPHIYLITKCCRGIVLILTIRHLAKNEKNTLKLCENPWVSLRKPDIFGSIIFRIYLVKCLTVIILSFYRIHRIFAVNYRDFWQSEWMECANVSCQIKKNWDA